MKRGKILIAILALILLSVSTARYLPVAQAKIERVGMDPDAVRILQETTKRRHERRLERERQAYNLQLEAMRQEGQIAVERIRQQRWTPIHIQTVNPQLQAVLTRLVSENQADFTYLRYLEETLKTLEQKVEKIEKRLDSYRRRNEQLEEKVKLLIKAELKRRQEQRLNDKGRSPIGQKN